MSERFKNHLPEGTPFYFPQDSINYEEDKGVVRRVRSTAGMPEHELGLQFVDEEVQSKVLYRINHILKYALNGEPFLLLGGLVPRDLELLGRANLALLNSSRKLAIRGLKERERSEGGMNAMLQICVDERNGRYCSLAGIYPDGMVRPEVHYVLSEEEMVETMMSWLYEKPYWAAVRKSTYDYVLPTTYGSVGFPILPVTTVKNSDLVEVRKLSQKGLAGEELEVKSDRLCEYKRYRDLMNVLASTNS